jgi:hypothetical protein
MKKSRLFKIRAAIPADVPAILQMIKELADFEKIEVSATEKNLQEAFFHDPKGPEALIAEEDHIPIGYLIFFSNAILAEVPHFWVAISSSFCL